MAHEHHPDTGGRDLVEDVIRKSFQIGAPKTMGLVRGFRVFGDASDGRAQFVAELVREPLGNPAIIGKCLLHIPPDERAKDYFHAARSRSTEAQKSSELIGATFPSSSSRRRRSASWRLSE